MSLSSAYPSVEVGKLISTSIDIPSAASIDLNVATGATVHVTGSATIYSILLDDGVPRTIIFDGSATLVHDQLKIDLPGEADITVSPGDVMTFVGAINGLVYCTDYQIGAYLPGSSISLSSTQIASITDATIKALSTTAIVGLTNDQISALSPNIAQLELRTTTQVAALEYLDIGSSLTAILANLSTAQTATFVAGEDIDAFRFVYIDTDNKIKKASNSNPLHLGRVHGVTLVSAVSGGSATVINLGMVTNPGWTLTTNPPFVFLSSDGEMTQTPPTSGFLCVVGYVVSATQFFVRIQSSINLI